MDNYIDYCLSRFCLGLMTYHEVLYKDHEKKVIHAECQDCGMRTTK